MYLSYIEIKSIAQCSLIFFLCHRKTKLSCKYLLKPLSFQLFCLQQGMEIVQTMNSDPGLAVGKLDSTQYFPYR